MWLSGQANCCKFLYVALVVQIVLGSPVSQDEFNKDKVKIAIGKKTSIEIEGVDDNQNEDGASNLENPGNPAVVKEDEVFPGPLRMVKDLKMRVSNEELDGHVKSDNGHSIRDFFRRRRQKTVGEMSEAAVKLAPNQTASGILMKKIKESKEREANNYFDPSAESVEASLTSKRKRLVRVRPKFNEVNATEQNQTLVTVSPSATATSSSPPRGSPPLIAATNTLLSWNDGKESDWSKKRANSIITSRLRNYRERKKNETLKNVTSKQNQTQALTTPGLNESILPPPTLAAEVQTTSLTTESEVQKGQDEEVVVTTEANFEDNSTIARESDSQETTEANIEETSTAVIQENKSEAPIPEVTTSAVLNHVEESEEIPTTTKAIEVEDSDVKEDEAEVETKDEAEVETKDEADVETKDGEEEAVTEDNHAIQDNDANTEPILDVTTMSNVEVTAEPEVHVVKVETESTTPTEPMIEISTEQPYLSLEKLFIDQIISNEEEEGVETQKKRRKVTIGSLVPDVDQNIPSEITLENSLEVADHDGDLLLDAVIEPEIDDQDESVVNSDWGLRIPTSQASFTTTDNFKDEPETTSSATSDFHLDDIVIAGIEKSLQISIPFDTKLRYRIPTEETDFDLPNNFFRYSLLDSSTGFTHTRVESQEESGMVHGFYDLQDPECKIKRLHYKASITGGFQVSKIEDKECEDTSSRLHEGQEQNITSTKGSVEEESVPEPYIINNLPLDALGTFENQGGEVAEPEPESEHDHESDYEDEEEYEEEEVEEEAEVPYTAVPDLKDIKVNVEKSIPSIPPRHFPDTFVETSSEIPQTYHDSQTKRKVEVSDFHLPSNQSSSPFQHLSSLWDMPTSPHHLFGYTIQNGLSSHPSEKLLPDLFDEKPGEMPITITHVAKEYEPIVSGNEGELLGVDPSYDPFDFQNTNLPSEDDVVGEEMTTQKSATFVGNFFSVFSDGPSQTAVTTPSPTSSSMAKSTPPSTEITLKVEMDKNEDLSSPFDGLDYEDEEEIEAFNFGSTSHKDEVTLKPFVQSSTDQMASPGLTVAPISLLADSSNHVKQTNKPTMARIPTRVQNNSNLPELKRVTKSLPFASAESSEEYDEDSQQILTRNMLMNIILRPGGGDRTRALPRPHVDVKSEGNNVIVVKMTFPENENIQGLRAYAPTESTDLEKFDAVHNAISPSARIEQVRAVNLDDLPNVQRTEREIRPMDNHSKENSVIISSNVEPQSKSGTKDLVEEILTTEPPTRPTRPPKSSATFPPVSLVSTPSPTPHFIETASFPLQYFTEDEVITEKKLSVPANKPKPVHPINFPPLGHGNNHARPGAVTFYQPPPTANDPHPRPFPATPSTPIERRLTPPPRPKSAASIGRYKSYPPPPPTYPGFF